RNGPGGRAGRSRRRGADPSRGFRARNFTRREGMAQPKTALRMPSGWEVGEPMSRSVKRAVPEGFDPYHRWLGGLPGRRPPTHYQLLGVSPEEEDLEVIHAAALRQSAYVRNFQSGPHADLAARVLAELAEARAALTDPARRKEYDTRLAR